MAARDGRGDATSAAARIAPEAIELMNTLAPQAPELAAEWVRDHLDEIASLRWRDWSRGPRRQP